LKRAANVLRATSSFAGAAVRWAAGVALFGASCGRGCARLNCRCRLLDEATGCLLLLQCGEHIGHGCCGADNAIEDALLDLLRGDAGVEVLGPQRRELGLERLDADAVSLGVELHDSLLITQGELHFVVGALSQPTAGVARGGHPEIADVHVDDAGVVRLDADLD
jgi:hypothetical protein